jgi:hypothetical protein
MSVSNTSKPRNEIESSLGYMDEECKRCIHADSTFIIIVSTTLINQFLKIQLAGLLSFGV